MKLSIVTTLYRSAATVDEFYRRVIAAAEPITGDIELVMVNDGSPDDSLARAIALHQADPRVVVVDLSRNFGHHKALMTGLAQASGDLVFLVDSDLEEEPELLTRFHERLSQGDCDVVYGVQEVRRGHWFERVTGELFFALVNALGDQPLPRNVLVARLMTRAYVRTLVAHGEREFLIGNLFQLAGYRQVPLQIRKLSTSPTTYSFRMRLEMAVKHLTTTSTRLLYYVMYGGTAIFVTSLFTIVYYLFRYFTSGIGVSGYTSLIISIWFFGGVTTLVLGTIGIYVADILVEVKQRPYTAIREIYRAEVAENVIHVIPRDQRHETGRGVQ
ncbi:glycosyltransferase family 2 protein [Bradyrhizobium betae]|uniref:Glycosyl transferase n=1 Tax=Bradyrhizobium betae TaxID=244734 RepID=A0A4V1P487_9BRAD|nr:glycosyltransferase family 2 protein [Bradyrhizobium betae]RXT36732.1 glycosyl transferase [Bradyrhizobium betae]